MTQCIPQKTTNIYISYYSSPDEYKKKGAPRKIDKRNVILAIGYDLNTGEL
jgi:hypothetical protein